MTIEKWERITEPIMMALSVAFLVVYAGKVLAEPYGPLDTAVDAVLYALWAIFALDYIVRFVLVPGGKWRWFVGHLFDLLSVILPMFRMLRLVFYITRLKFLRENGSQAFRARIITYTIATSILVLFVGSLAILDVERNAPLTQINTYAKALWCVWVSTTSVGYGDVTPVTAKGRFVAGILMFAGIILNGIICALLSSWLIQEESIRKNREDRLTKERIAKINGRMDEVSKGLAEIRATLDMVADATVPWDEDGDEDGDKAGGDDDEDEEGGDGEGDEDGEDATVKKAGEVPVAEQMAEKMVRDSIREAQQDTDSRAMDDTPDPDSGYTQMATSAAAYANRPKPAARDPKADRLTGEKSPSTFRRNPDPTVTGRILPVRKD